MAEEENTAEAENTTEANNAAEEQKSKRVLPKREYV